MSVSHSVYKIVCGFAVIAIGVWWVFNTLFWRYQAEHKNNTVDICIDSIEADNLCRTENYPLEQFLSEAKFIGVSSIAIYEESLDLSVYPLLVRTKPENNEAFSQKFLSLAGQTGLGIVFRPVNHTYKSFGVLIEKFGRNLKPGQKVSVISAGDEALGYQDHQEWVASVIKAMNLKFPMVEFSKQAGADKLAGLVPGHVIRAHTVDTGEDLRLSYDMLIARYVRAVKERGCRMLYVHLLSSRGCRGNLDMIKDISGRLTGSGFKAGPVSPPSYRSGGYVYLRILFALIISVVFPVLGLWSALKCISRLSFYLNFLVISGVSFAGALFAGSLLSCREFMLGIYSVTGIKLALILPLLVAVGLLFSGENIRSFLLRPMRNIEFLAICLGMVFIGIMVIRSGNYGMLDSGLEKYAREIFERFFGVRPRFKEFLIGHPAMLAGLWLGARRSAGIRAKSLSENRLWKFLVLAGMAGQVSIVNTFLHAHVPLEVSILRTLHGLWIGLVFGLLLIVVISVRNTKSFLLGECLNP